MNVLYFVIPLLLLWFAYIAYDSWGLQPNNATVTVKEKKFYPGGTTYAPTAIPINPAKPTGGLSMPVDKPDVYMVNFDLNGKPSGGLVTKEMYDSINPGDTVQVKWSQSRLTKRILVTEVAK